jgi:voltage-gated potassium channel
MKTKPPQKPWQKKLYEIIFEADTPGGKAFDVALLIAIVISVLAAILESVDSVAARIGNELRILEWFFTGLFTIEYLFRIVATTRPLKYMTSFLGIIDFLSIAPTYLSLIFAGAQTLIIIRAVRLLRVYRILKLVRHVTEANILIQALKAGRFKITVFLTTVISIVLIMGTLMYLVEGEERGFTNIPTSIYWAVITLTTVGYGDIVPQTFIGQAISTIIMIIGYSIIAIPTGILSAELIRGAKNVSSTNICKGCGRDGHDTDAKHCKYCGLLL